MICCCYGKSRQRGEGGGKGRESKKKNLSQALSNLAYLVEIRRGFDQTKSKK